MGKFYGPVGYSIEVEKSPGLFTDEITERTYYGTVKDFRTSYVTNSQQSEQDTTSLNCTIEINADPFALEHFHQIKWVKYMGVKWKVTSATPKRPRIILSPGGVWNEE